MSFYTKNIKNHVTKNKPIILVCGLFFCHAMLLYSQDKSSCNFPASNSRQRAFETSKFLYLSYLSGSCIPSYQRKLVNTFGTTYTGTDVDSSRIYQKYILELLEVHTRTFCLMLNCTSSCTNPLSQLHYILHWTSIPKVAGSILTVVRQTFQLARCGVHTHSNITNIIDH